MGRKPKDITALKKKALGLIDSRQTDNDGLLIKRDKSVTMIDIFGTEQKTAVAYYVSDLLAKGFNNQQIIDAVKDKYSLEWKIRDVNIIKELLHKMWRCEIAHTMNDQIAREVATIDTQLRETWAAWEFSKKGIKRTQTRTENSKGKSEENTYNLTEIINSESITAGDIKFMQHINDLGKEKRKLLGLYAPEKKENNNTPQAIQFNIVGEGSSEHAADLMSMLMNGVGNIGSVDKTEDAEVISTENADNLDPNIDIDKFIGEILD